MDSGGNAAHANEKRLNTFTPQGKFPMSFFLLVFLLSVPFWLLSGKRKLPLPVDLPVSALGAFVPATAAAIVTYRASGLNGVRRLLAKTFDYRNIKNKLWIMPALLLMPLIYGLSFVIMRISGMPLPDRIELPLSGLPGFIAMFFIGGAGEEMGWTGYATDPIQQRWGKLKGGLIFGVLYALWHAVPFVQTGRPAPWIVWQTLSAIPLRMLHMWIYNSAGNSVFASILFHVSVNLSWTFFPNYGSHYDPFVAGILTAITTVIVTVGWGTRTLAGKDLSA